MTTKTPYTPPAYRSDNFNCPICGTYAYQHWSSICWTATKGANFSPADGYDTSRCYRCSNHAIWFQKKMVFPDIRTVDAPNEDLSPDIKGDYEEAATILNRSPRGSAALLRLCIQKLCKQLGEPGKNIDDDIAALVKKGLSPMLQQALDIVRVIGNNAVHPGVMDLTDKPETAVKLFRLVNHIAYDMITKPREIKELYGELPQKNLDAIEKRDGKVKGTP